jgi:carbon monoxide dehydrogenase subunit G
MGELPKGLADGSIFLLVQHDCMQLTGRQKVNATPATLWNMLMDTDTLSKIVPGISKLEKTGDNSYKSILEIKIGPVGGSFTGNLQMEDVDDQKGFTLKVQQSSSIGNANAAIRIELVPVTDKETEVAFDGDVKVTGLLASIGQRILGSAANVLTKQFFTNLDTELAKQQPAS